MRDRLLDWAMMIAAAEEAARMTQIQIAGPIVVQALGRKYTTKTGRDTDVTLPAKLLDEAGAGALKELVIWSSTDQYVLRVIADGKIIYSAQYSWFVTVSQEVREIAAFQAQDGRYVLHLSDIKFSKGIRVEAAPAGSSSVTLDEVFWKVELSV